MQPHHRLLLLQSADSQLVAHLQVPEAAQQLADDLKAEQDEQHKSKKARLDAKMCGQRRWSDRSAAAAASQRLRALAAEQGALCACFHP
jgi:hypothetical protein